MRKFGLIVALALGVVMSLGSVAKAATVEQNIGTLDAGRTSSAFGFTTTYNNATKFKLNSGGTGNFTVDFTVGIGTTQTNSAVLAIAANAGAVDPLQKFTLTLYDSLNNALASVTEAAATSNKFGTFVTLDFASFLASGAYHLVLDVTQGLGNQIINGQIAINPVPVPAALPMFGAVLVGLMAIQARRRNRFNA